MADTYLQVEELIELSEFDYVKTKAPNLLAFYVTRAHTMAQDYGPFPTFEGLSANAELLAQFQTDMRVALFIVSEGLVLANPARPMEAAGVTQERLAQLNLSRAEGGGRAGKAHPSSVVNGEALKIFHRWALGTSELLKAVRTDVFEPTHSYDVNDPRRKVLTREDLDDLSLELRPRPSGPGGQLFDADQ